ncbi:hypothetical protein ACLESD_16440, partial [Pyxidicoccus sp. 3LFB2]
MRRYVLALCPLLLAVGCRHANLPDLPASHGHLSDALERYVDDSGRIRDPDAAPWSSLFEEDPEVAVEPHQAPAIFREATEALSGKPTAEQTRQAVDDLKATCLSGLLESCVFLRENYKLPTLSNGALPDFPKGVLRKQLHTAGVVSCRLGVEGLFRDCSVLEGGVEGVAEALLDFARRARFHPATVAGHPIDIPYTFQVKFSPARPGVPMPQVLPEDQRLQWARARAAHAPASPMAWGSLAMQLARMAPEDPWYRQALRHAQELSPGAWWAANELAWLQVEEGRYADAAPLATRARAISPGNPYVLETFAAVLAGTNQCEQAVSEQRRAVAALPKEWPAPERERFTRALEAYQRGCPATPV